MPGTRRTSPGGKSNITEITSDMVGSSNPEPTSIPTAQPGTYPEGYEDHPAGWKKAYDHAASRGNTQKGAVNWADGHEADDAT